MKNTNILEVKNLTFGYEDEPVLENFNMSISKNEILLIDGENGAGKTTLLKCITNIINNGKNIRCLGNGKNCSRASLWIIFLNF